MHISGKLVHIFRKLVHIFAWKLVQNSSKQVSRYLGTFWQPGVYNDANLLFDIFRAGQKTSKIVKKYQKYFRHFFDNFRAAPIFRPLLGGSEAGEGFSEILYECWLCALFQRKLL